MSDASSIGGLPVLVSACLLGRRCRYDGETRVEAGLVERLGERGEVAVGFCPEEEGGLPTPRPAAALEADADAVLGGQAEVRTQGGEVVTEAFRRGAEAALAMCRERGIGRAYLKEHSPSCGVRSTSVRFERVEGQGLTARLLWRAGIEIVGVEGSGSTASRSRGG